MNHFFREFIQFAFLIAKDAGNEFAWPIYTSIHRLIDFNEVAFQDDKKAVRVFRAISLLETSLR
jgi:hypothetical protein